VCVRGAFSADELALAERGLFHARAAGIADVARLLRLAD